MAGSASSVLTWRETTYHLLISSTAIRNLPEKLPEGLAGGLGHTNLKTVRKHILSWETLKKILSEYLVQKPKDKNLKMGKGRHVSKDIFKKKREQTQEKMLNITSN